MKESEKDFLEYLEAFPPDPQALGKDVPAAAAAEPDRNRIAARLDLHGLTAAEA